LGKEYKTKLYIIEFRKNIFANVILPVCCRGGGLLEAIWNGTLEML
jgi:hypothetical protein